MCIQYFSFKDVNPPLWMYWQLLVTIVTELLKSSKLERCTASEESQFNIDNLMTIQITMWRERAHGRRPKHASPLSPSAGHLFHTVSLGMPNCGRHYFRSVPGSFSVQDIILHSYTIFSTTFIWSPSSNCHWKWKWNEMKKNITFTKKDNMTQFLSA